MKAPHGQTMRPAADPMAAPPPEAHFLPEVPPDETGWRARRHLRLDFALVGSAVALLAATLSGPLWVPYAWLDQAYVAFQVAGIPLLGVLLFSLLQLFRQREPKAGGPLRRPALGDPDFDARWKEPGPKDPARGP